MRPDEDDIAYLVQAFSFQLLNSAGLVVMDLGEFAGPPPDSRFIFHHLDPAVTDSLLRWTVQAAGLEALNLQGPAAVGSGLGEVPNLGMTYSQISGERLIILTPGSAGGSNWPSVELRDGGGTKSAEISSDFNVGTVWRASDVFTTYQTQWAVYEVGIGYALLLDATKLALTQRHLEMNNQKIIKAYDTGGTLRDVIHPRWSDNRLYLSGGTGLSLRVNDGGTTVARGESDGSFRINSTLHMDGNNVGPYWTNWGIGWFAQDATWLRTYNNASVWAANGWLGTDAGVTIGTGGATSGTFGVFCAKPGTFTWVGGGGAGGFGTAGGAGCVGHNDTNTNLWHFNWDGVALREYVDATLVKSFVIDHPSDPSKLLVHACSEGETADVFYRGEARLVDGLAEVVLPDYFEALTELEGRTVQVTPIVEMPTAVSLIEPLQGPGIAQRLPAVPGYAVVGQTANLAVSRVEGGRFYVTLAGGMMNLGQPFYWRVDAIRKGTAFQVEPDKASTQVVGDGPYRYVVASAP